MHVCNRCGKENQDHYKFCLGCGSELGEDVPLTPLSTAAVVPLDSRALDAGWTTSAPQIVHGKPGTLHDTDPGQTQAPPSRGAGAPWSVQPTASPATASDGGTRACPTCSAPVPTGFLFCGQCGSRVTDAPARPAAPVASAPTRGKVVLIRPDGSEGGAQQLLVGTNRIGRGLGVLFEGDSYLSPHHCDLILTAGSLVVRDANSLNGVFVKLTEEEEVLDGEVFRVGQELLRFDVIRPPAPLDDGTEVMGSPNPGYWGRLALVLGREQDGSAFPLFGDAVVLGRERGDILFPEDGYVSGTHARLSYRGGRFYLADLNSSNGTFLRIRRERSVRSGTFVLMGQQLFRIHYA